MTWALSFYLLYYLIVRVPCRVPSHLRDGPQNGVTVLHDIRSPTDESTPYAAVFVCTGPQKPTISHQCVQGAKKPSLFLSMSAETAV